MRSVRNFSLICVIFLISACQTRISESDWPTNLPPQAYFVESGTRLIGASTPDFERKLSAYLTWIKRFYLGSIIYPLGWNEMSESVVASLDDVEEKEDIADRLFELGKLISAEWAQENKDRRITSTNVAAWGNALRTAVEVNEQDEFVTRVERDVQDLLAGKLDPKEVTRERYYAPPSYDDF